MAVNLDGQAIIDESNRAPGRGAYVCNQECLQLALEKNLIPHALRQKVDTGGLKTYN